MRGRTKHFNRVDELSTLLKRMGMDGKLALRNFPRMQQREAKIRLRNYMEDALRGSGNYALGAAEEEIEKMAEKSDLMGVCRQTWRKM